MSPLFISDLHLTEERPEANERFIEFVEDTARGAEALYILGDFFEYWIGDDDLEQPFNAVIAGLLASLTRGGVRLYFMHGNRDFLVGDRFCAATGASLLPDPVVHEIPGVHTLLVHGDTLCTDDVEYQAWRRKARDPAFQARFSCEAAGGTSAPHPADAREEQGSGPGKARGIMDVNAEAVIEALRRHGVRRLIHGHTHRPGRHRVGSDGERWVLPDWYGRGGYLEINQRGAPRQRF